MLNDNDKEMLLFRSKFLKQKKYWLNKLSGEFEVTDIIPAVFQHGPGLSGSHSMEINFPSQCNQRIMAISKTSDISIYILLLSILKILVYRYTANPDIIIISPVYKAKIKEETINHLLLIRDQVDGNSTFKELVIKVRETLLNAHENQDYPSDKLFEYLFADLGENPGSNLVSQVLCAMDSLHANEDIEKIKARFSFRFSRVDDQLKGYMVYEPGSVADSFAAQLLNHFINLLSAAVENVNMAIADIPFLTEPEKKKLIQEFNSNKVDFCTDTTIDRLIEEHALKEPGAAAVICGEQVITYRELINRANRLAGILKNFGVKQDQAVNILLKRSPRVVESILAIWKAGGAYIPIDPDFPLDRIKYICTVSQAEILLTETHAVRDYSLSDLQTLGVQVVKGDRLTEDFPGSSTGHIETGARSGNLAYIIFTSGSTGMPKGAMVEHLGMMNHINAKVNDLEITRECILAQNASYTFDISVWQFFTALTRGGKTVIYEDEIVMEPEFLSIRLAKDKIMILEVVPSYLSVMLEFLHPGVIPLKSLKYLITTGETVPTYLVERWFKKYPDIKMVNAYGPTEASDDITHFIIDKVPENNFIPIGKPIQNLNIYIVDKYMKLCPPGVIGEICVSGVGVGRGYLNDDIQTQMVFGLDPFSGANKVRLYKTGDMGRWMADGNIEFHGRKDYQVKLRGFRIELGEIENRLNRYPGIKEAAVVVKKNSAPGVDNGLNEYLCAYMVMTPLAASNEKEAEASLIREYLAKELPIYMVPEYFIELENMPLTPNGKLDRKTLSRLDADIPLKKDLTPCRDNLDTKLLDVWTQVLGIAKDAIGIDSNFFELGGHSLNATIMLAKVHKEFDIKLTQMELFKDPTIRGLSEIIKKAHKEKYITIEPVPEKEYYALSSGQKRLYFLQLKDLSSIVYNMPAIFVSDEALDKNKLADTFKKLINRHEALRTSFDFIDGILVQKIKKEIDFEIEFYDDRDDSTEQAIISAFIRSFDLGRAPLIRAGLLHTKNGKNILMVDMHHIITDGVSYTILIKDFTDLYMGKELPGLRLHYKDFSEWQNKLAMSGEMKNQENYWLKEFTGDIPSLNLPLDFSRPVIQDFTGDLVDFEIGLTETEALNRFAVNEDATLFMVLLAIYNTCLSKITMQQDILVGTGITGRRHNDLLQIIGMFVNTLVLRNQPKKEMRFKDFLQEVKKKTLLAFENQDYPFEELVEKVFPNKAWNRNPLFDTVLVSQDVGLNPVNTAGVIPEGLNLRPYDFKSKNSKFDLSLFYGMSGEKSGEKLIFTFQYSTKLFKRETIERFIVYFKEIVSIVVKDNEIKLDNISLTHNLMNAPLNNPEMELGF